MTSSDKHDGMGVDMTESIGLETTEKRFEVDPKVPEVQHAPEQGSNIQKSMIEDNQGKIIDLGESIAVSPAEGASLDETK